MSVADVGFAAFTGGMATVAIFVAPVVLMPIPTMKYARRRIAWFVTRMPSAVMPPARPMIIVSIVMPPIARRTPVRTVSTRLMNERRCGMSVLCERWQAPSTRIGGECAEKQGGDKHRQFYAVISHDNLSYAVQICYRQAGMDAKLTKSQASPQFATGFWAKLS